MTPLTLEERNKLVEENMGLATHFASKFRASRMEFEDLVQEAYLGLMDAAERFDPSLGNKFSTYARWHVMKTIMDAIHTRNEIVRVPRRKTSLPCKSLDDAPDGLVPIGNMLVDDAPPVCDVIDEADKIDAVHDCIRKLPAREAIVIRLRHGVNTERMTLAKVGAILGVSPERVRQIQQSGEEKLRALVLECATLQDHGAVTAGRLKEPAHPNPKNDPNGT